MGHELVKDPFALLPVLLRGLVVAPAEGVGPGPLFGHVFREGVVDKPRKHLFLFRHGELLSVLGGFLRLSL